MATKTKKSTTAKTPTSKVADGMTPTGGIQIVSNPREEIPVELVGETYVASPPKTSLAIRVAKVAQGAQDMVGLMDSLHDWVVAAFGRTTGAEILKRLDDPEDDLDVMHIVQLVQVMMQRQTENPTM